MFHRYFQSDSEQIKENNFEFHSGRAQWVLLAVFLLIRIPWALSGFGRDGDDWRIALSARFLLETGFYLPSRSFGYPTVELGIIPLVNFGWFYVNTLTATISFLGVLALSRMLCRNEVKNRGLIVILWAFFPVALDYSASTSDFMWAMSFVLMAWDAADANRRKSFIAFMALAIGSRPTIGLFLFPLAYILVREDYNKWKEFLKYFLACCTIAALLYIPARLRKSVLDVVIILGNLGRFDPERLDLAEATIFAIGEYGLLSSIMLFGASLISIRSLMRDGVEGFSRDSWLVLASQIPIVIHHLPYVDKMGYLLPAVMPLLIIVLPHLSKKVCSAVVVVILLEGMVTIHPTAIVDNDVDFLGPGYALRRLEERNDFVDLVGEVEELDHNNTVFILGWQHIVFRWQQDDIEDCKELMPCRNLPQFGHTDRDIHGPTYDSNSNNSYYSVLNQNEIDQVIQANFTIVYSEVGHSMTMGALGIDLSQIPGAKELGIDWRD